MPTPRHLALLAVALSTGALVSGCATLTAPATAHAPAASRTAGALDTPQAQAEYHVLVGTLAARRQQPGFAAQQLLAASREASDAQLAAQAIALATRAGDDALALQATEQLSKLKPDDISTLAAVLELAIRNDQSQLAIKTGQQLLTVGSANLGNTYHGIAVTLGQPQLLRYAGLASQVMQQLVAEHAQLAAAQSAGALLAVRQYRGNAAINAARKALLLKPHDVNATMLLAAALVQQGKLDTADATVEKLLHTLPASSQTDLRLGYAQVLMRYGRFRHARQRLMQQLHHSPTDADVLLLLAQADLRTNQLDDARRALDRVPNSGAKLNSEVEYSRGRLAELEHDYPAAIKHYTRAAEGDMALPAGLQQALVMGEMGNTNGARKLLITLAQAHPDHLADIIAADSEVLLKAGKQADALQILDRALEHAPDDADLRYQRALVYDRGGKSAKAEKTLRQLVDEYPLDAQYLNALGYVLAEYASAAPGQLDEAQTLISKALQLTPEDPAVLDSMGWVLFRQGHAQQAVHYLRQAQALSGDPEIAAHLVMVLTATGNATAARQVLREALARNPGNQTLEKTAKKLQP